MEKFLHMYSSSEAIAESRSLSNYVLDFARTITTSQMMTIIAFLPQIRPLLSL